MVSQKSAVVKAARNLPGVDVAFVDSLNVENLAPGTHAGRLTVWSHSALQQLGKKFSEAD